MPKINFWHKFWGIQKFGGMKKGCDKYETQELQRKQMHKKKVKEK